MSVTPKRGEGNVAGRHAKGRVEREREREREREIKKRRKGW
jgi:hypothetical protein